MLNEKQQPKLIFKNSAVVKTAITIVPHIYIDSKYNINPSSLYYFIL